MQPDLAITAVAFSWRLLDNRRIQASFLVEALEYDVSKDRIVCVLRELLTLIDPSVPEETRALIVGLPGHYVNIPSEARLGLTLPLKYETLTKQIRYFYTTDPRRGEKRGKADVVKD
jgi:hypothetical protein